MENFKFSIGNLIIISTIIICLLVVNFVREAGLKSDKKSAHSLGLPAGTVRATIALVLIVFFILIAFYAILIDPETANLGILENILTTLATLVISAVSFYFGIKATEQGSEIATKIWGNSIKGKEGDQDLDPKIIQEALNRNKETWIKKYGCKDIRLGKKQTSDGQVNLNCLVFFVAEKKDPSTLEETSIKIVPPTIPFEFQGNSYSIPTDVRPYSEVEGQQHAAPGQTTEDDFKKLDPDAQKGIIRDFIRENASDLIKKYPDIQGISDFKKITQNLEKDYYAIQFKVAVKDTNLSSANKIPQFFEYDNGTGKKYLIPTDIIPEGILKEAVWDGRNETTKSLGLSISRQGSQNVGTIGLKVFWKGHYHALTCCHVLFRRETEEDSMQTTFQGNEVDVISPGEKDKGINNPDILGKLTFGWYDNYLDIALTRLVEEKKLDNKLYNNNGTVSGIKRLSEEDNVKKTPVMLLGRTSHKKDGTIYDYFQSETYIGEKKRLVEDLIVCDLRSEGGDSGAIVVEKETKNIIGILIASSDKFSYIIRIDKIINRINIEKENNPWLTL